MSKVTECSDTRKLIYFNDESREARKLKQELVNKGYTVASIPSNHRIPLAMLGDVKEFGYANIRGAFLDSHTHKLSGEGTVEPAR